MYKQSRLVRAIGGRFRKRFRNRLERKKLKNSDFTIFANECAGGVMYSDLGLEFKSPTINLYIRPSDFVRFMESPQYYLSKTMTEVMESGLPYPVGRLEDIHIFFVHYKSFREAEEKWNIRKERINWENVYVIMSDRYCLPYDYRKRFEELPYKNKVLLSVKAYPEITSTRLLKKNNDTVCVGVSAHIQNVFGKRLYQYAKNFNYISWLNGGRE